tara:strand:- start:5277 stop:5816 length:540 start_codon:yes stop_codon:yes gene_type:complete
MLTANFKKRHADLQAYLKSYRGQKPNSERLILLGTDAPNTLNCPISLDIMDIPIKIITTIGAANYTHYFDIKSIMACPEKRIDGKNYRVHPLNRSMFSSEDILPAPEMQQKITEFLNEQQAVNLAFMAGSALTAKAESNSDRSRQNPGLKIAKHRGTNITESQKVTSRAGVKIAQHRKF